MLQGIANIGLVNRRITLGIYNDYRKSLYCLLPLTFLLSFILITAISFTFSTTLNFATVYALPSSESYIFLNTWGSQGTGNGQFVNPTGIAINPANNNLYVVDSGNNRIEEFYSNGTFITQWGSIGAGDGQFNRPTGIAVDNNTGNVFVVDSGNNRIQKFNGDGSIVLSIWNASGANSIIKTKLPSVAVTPSGDVYQTGTSTAKIYKYSTDGLPLKLWGSNGIGVNQFSLPTGIAIDKAGNVFVLDSANYRIQKFDNNDNFTKTWGYQGTGDSQFLNPTGIAVDSSGNVYVANAENNRIEVFSKVNNTSSANNSSSQTVNESATSNLNNVDINDSSNQIPYLNGVWNSDDGGIYYISQIGNDVWWFGKSAGNPINYSNVFHGTIIDNTIIGTWVDVPMGISNYSGTLEIRIENDGSLHKITSEPWIYGSNYWTKIK
jgi:DNA-binding beta-propeller fold protein YncE